MTEQEIKLVLRKLTTVKEAGWGKVEIIISDHKITYSSYTIGEQAKMDLKEGY